MQQSTTTTTTTTTPYLPTYEEAVLALQQAASNRYIESLVDTYIVRPQFADDSSNDSRLSSYLQPTAVVPQDQRLILRRAKLQRNTVHWFATDNCGDNQSTSRGVKRKLDEEDCRLDGVDFKRHKVCQHYERWSAVDNLLRSNDVDY